MTRLSSLHESYITGGKGDGGYHFRERSKSGVNIMRSCTLREHRRRQRNERFLLRKPVRVCIVVEESTQKSCVTIRHLRVEAKAETLNLVTVLFIADTISPLSRNLMTA